MNVELTESLKLSMVMALSMLGSGKTTFRMEKVKCIFQTDHTIPGFFLRVLRRVKEGLLIRMVFITKGKFNVGKRVGRANCTTHTKIINMREIGKKTSLMGKGKKKVKVNGSTGDNSKMA